MNKKIKYDPFGDTLIKEVKKTGIEDDFIRQTFVVKKEYVEKIKFRAYWDRTSQKEILDNILRNYFKGKNIKPIPSKIQK
ncbi:hypothetical protein ES702_04891 [subsurface metagenome]